MDLNPYAYQEGWRTQLWTVRARSIPGVEEAGEQVNGMLAAIAEQRGEVIEIRHELFPLQNTAFFIVIYRIPDPGSPRTQ